MDRYRIKIDLSNFFGDERKLAYILVDPAWKSVSCLQNKVEEIFGLKDLCFVTAEGCFIPPQESVLVVKSDDVLKAFIPANSQTKKQKKSKRARVVDEVSVEKNNSPDAEVLGPKLKTRKYNTHDAIFTSSTPNEANPRKNAIVTIGNNSTVVNEITSTNDQLGLLKHEQQQQLSQLVTKQISNLDTRDEQIDFRGLNRQEQSAGSSSIILAKVKKRKHRIKKALVLAPKEENLVENVATPEAHTTDQSLFKAPKETSSTSNEFTDTLEKVITSTERKCFANENLTKIIFHCSLTEAKFENPRIFSLEKNTNLTPNNVDVIEDAETNTTRNAEPEKQISSQQMNDSERVAAKTPIIIQENIILTPSIDKVKEGNASAMEQTVQETTCAPDDSSVIAIESECDDSEDEKQSEGDKTEEISEVIDLNASDDDSQHGKNVTNTSKRKSHRKSLITEDELCTEKMLPFSVNLENLPSTGDVVIFKLPRFDGKVTGFIAGKCEYVNNRTKNIKLKIFDGLDQINRIANKYLCSVDDSVDNSEEQYLQVKLPDMIEPKLFSEN